MITEVNQVRDQYNTAMNVAVLRTMPNIAREWGIAPAMMATLLGMTEEIYSTWSCNPSQALLEDEHLVRASYILGIYKALSILLPNDQPPYWLNRPTQAGFFEGRRPIDHLRDGRLDALREMRDYLDAQTQGGFS